MPTLALMAAGLGAPAQYSGAGTVTTITMDLGAAALTRSVLVYADATTPAGTSCAAQLVRTSPDGTNWGEWAALDANGVTTWTPNRYLQAQVALTTTDPLQTPTLHQVGVYD